MWYGNETTVAWEKGVELEANHCDVVVWEWDNIWYGKLTTSSCPSSSPRTSVSKYAAKFWRSKSFRVFSSPTTNFGSCMKWQCMDCCQQHHHPNTGPGYDTIYQASQHSDQQMSVNVYWQWQVSDQRIAQASNNPGLSFWLASFTFSPWLQDKIWGLEMTEANFCQLPASNFLYFASYHVVFFSHWGKILQNSGFV